MNVATLLAAAVLLAIACIGIIGIASYHSEPVTDTFGHTYTNQTNQTMELGRNVTATAAETGGIGVIAIIIMFVCATLVAVLGLIIYGKMGNPSGRR